MKRHHLPIIPHENDVLLGRGGNMNLYVGNERLRELARNERERYKQASKKRKSEISRELVQKVRSAKPSGRFLKRHNVSMEWEDVGDSVARLKTSQVLRDVIAAQKILSNERKASGSSPISRTSEDFSTPTRHNKFGGKKDDCSSLVNMYRATEPEQGIQQHWQESFHPGRSPSFTLDSKQHRLCNPSIGYYETKRLKRMPSEHNSAADASIVAIGDVAYYCPMTETKPPIPAVIYLYPTQPATLSSSYSFPPSAGYSYPHDTVSSLWEDNWSCSRNIGRSSTFSNEISPAVVSPGSKSEYHPKQSYMEHSSSERRMCLSHDTSNNKHACSTRSGLPLAPSSQSAASQPHIIVLDDDKIDEPIVQKSNSFDFENLLDLSGYICDTTMTLCGYSMSDFFNHPSSPADDDKQFNNGKIMEDNHCNNDSTTDEFDLFDGKLLESSRDPKSINDREYTC